MGLTGSPPVLVKETTKMQFGLRNAWKERPHAPGRSFGSTAPSPAPSTCEEAFGSAVLVQTYAVHLRTRPLPRGTHYALDCAGPLILQLPDQMRPTFRRPRRVPPDCKPHYPSRLLSRWFRLQPGKKLRAESRTRFALVSQPPLAPGNYTVELGFLLPAARTFRQKVVYAASVSCGRSKCVQPIGRSSRRWRRCRRSRSSRPRSRPASPHRTSSGGSAATARRRAGSHAHAKRAPGPPPGSPGPSSPGSCRSPAIAR